MKNYVRIDEQQLQKLEEELKPEGRWVFPGDLAAMVARRVGLEENQPVWGFRDADIMARWDGSVLRRMAGEITGAYQISEATDYTTFWRAYALYYLPSNFPKVIRVLLELLTAGLLPRQARLLDLGVGPGTVPLAVVYFYSRLVRLTGDNLSVQIDMVDRWPGHLKLAGELLVLYSKILNVNFPVMVGITPAGCLEKGRDELAARLGKKRYNLVCVCQLKRGPCSHEKGDHP